MNEEFKKIIKVKKTIEKVTTEEIEVDEVVYDWDKIPIGTKFKAKIKGRDCEGRIYNGINHSGRKSIWLCQDRVGGGAAPEKLGYMYTYVIYQDNDSPETNEVEDLEFELDPKFNVKYYSPETFPLTDDYSITFYSHSIRVGCQTIPFEKVEEVYNKIQEIKKHVNG